MYVQPTVTFVHPADGPATEDTPVNVCRDGERISNARFKRAAG